MNKVRAKKHLGQHFLKDRAIAEQIASLIPFNKDMEILEIGPGMGVLTEYLLPVWKQNLVCIEIDKESTNYLLQAGWSGGLRLLQADFLKLKMEDISKSQNIALIGNYPYNISTEIAFKVIDQRTLVSYFGGMFQKEVAERFCAKHGSKVYGVTSVLLQAYYECNYLFTVDASSFSPPPKVKSGVMLCVRKRNFPDCEYRNLALMVKTAFGQRRKTLNNAFKSLITSTSGFELPEKWKPLRAEQLSVDEFVELTKLWENRT